MVKNSIIDDVGTMAAGENKDSIDDTTVVSAFLNERVTNNDRETTVRNQFYKRI